MGRLLGEKTGEVGGAVSTGRTFAPAPVGVVRGLLVQRVVEDQRRGRLGSRPRRSHGRGLGHGLGGVRRPTVTVSLDGGVRGSRTGLRLSVPLEIRGGTHLSRVRAGPTKPPSGNDPRHSLRGTPPPTASIPSAQPPPTLPQACVRACVGIDCPAHRPLPPPSHPLPSPELLAGRFHGRTAGGCLRHVHAPPLSRSPRGWRWCLVALVVGGYGARALAAVGPGRRAL